MQIKLFGKKLFEYNKGSSDDHPVISNFFNCADDALAKSKYLPDFYSNTGSSLDDFVSSSVALTMLEDKVKKSDPTKKAKQPAPEPKHLTPKEVYTMKMLNDEHFTLKTNKDYVEGQIKSFKDKLSMIKAEEYDMNRGVKEISSMIIRMENRLKYGLHEGFYSQFAYTTGARLADLIKNHGYLKIGQIAQFMADMPDDAVQIMKDYTSETEILCKKKPVFYIVADKKDFEKTEKRRDPILLAQSPFGHFWQILGAWDKELLLLGEL